jgi:RecJ-like exonuclease
MDTLKFLNTRNNTLTNSSFSNFTNRLEDTNGGVCGMCNGSGTLDCPDCGGTGDFTCVDCNGSGELSCAGMTRNIS